LALNSQIEDSKDSALRWQAVLDLKDEQLKKNCEAMDNLRRDYEDRSSQAIQEVTETFGDNQSQKSFSDLMDTQTAIQQRIRNLQQELDDATRERLEISEERDNMETHLDRIRAKLTSMSASTTEVIAAQKQEL
jgi:predicted  nucleic acid-binding Zn-ribbon protein